VSHVEKLSMYIEAEATHGGRPLDIGLGRELERCFDTDLSAIEVHDSSQADRLTRALRANAFATGPHLFFRASAYRPETEAGLWLLAHEVAHSVQQAAGVKDHGGPTVNLEIEADRAADCVLVGKPGRLAADLSAVRPRPVGAPLLVQRHASWEHRLLGDARSADLNNIAQNAADRESLLAELRDYLWMWHDNPDQVTPQSITQRYPYIRTLKLKTSGLLVTYGELNTLPDYLASAADMDELPRDTLLPILQAVRQEGFYSVVNLLGITVPFVKFDRAVTTHLSNGTINDIWESIWLNDLTANLPANVLAGSNRQHTDSYSALLARNACHFAPYSWYRWGLAYDLAFRKAEEYFKTGRVEAQREAWTYLGYADHFLQDSFAAGHLINKTLVMQWFVEWAGSKVFEKVPDWVEVQTLTAARQPGIAAPGLYNPADPGGTRDPQTAEEQGSRDERMAMSGVQPDGPISRDVAYQNFLTFLNNSVVQSSSLALHDYLNTSGVYVTSKDQKDRPFLLYGDNTMLSGGDGVRIASDTAHMSQQSIQDVLDKGTTSLTKEVVQSRFPTSARPERGDDMLPLQQWNASLRDRALAVFEGVHDIILGVLNPHMGHVSQDQDYFLIKLSYGGLQGYLGRDSSQWAVLADHDHAAKLRVRYYEDQIYYGTEDGWWLSVEAAAGRRGYVGFYWWDNAGHPDWKYDKQAKRLTSSFYDRAPMSIGSDSYIYCWSDYPAADVELQDM
jgi:Domain of unknown function (DUF4157)